MSEIWLLIVNDAPAWVWLLFAAETAGAGWVGWFMAKKFKEWGLY